ncbi:MAG TPA: hypothetical protein VIY73_18680, partial [Polyangiaceae bacterium]
MRIRVGQLGFAALTSLACSGALACGGSVSTRSSPGGVDAGTTEAGVTVDAGTADAGPMEAGVAGEAAPATGPKCGLSPTTLIEATSLVLPDAGSVGISSAMDVAVNSTDVYVAVSYGSNGAL